MASPKRMVYQNFYCKYCAAKVVRRIGTGKPPGSMICRRESTRRKVTTYHRWIYGDKW